MLSECEATGRVLVVRSTDRASHGDIRLLRSKFYGPIAPTLDRRYSIYRLSGLDYSRFYLTHGILSSQLTHNTLARDEHECELLVGSLPY